ncbi:MAG: dTDP-Rha--alpha-D-GlcNAc-pyrophosphate polyprenol alpha-3-L-rhamnosyltransferase [Cytophagales bacterium CG12_big_fil_rev_8_21_14_0_65_40_12]|nr:MAG: dTDP-Rha--alpha-D-GlcNAc-pyrophosphate polyprenol alpha-3-L-rhamnosyltransferase [Cytophagales bacterium CG12_big_fil_rev_8_21_14_0_65_40_12]PIW05620.1 MAG: dTDP-Rha--alpha-D-GlcNAc-pyrophosphate polyprenol alpha-3-L-rhamnosyltransferase [Cytophagales bacterium CG17_big_fil_post_rev_8_21_14_2_50_40_13]
MIMNTPLISIITVNYKQAKVTCELLDSLQKLSYPKLEVIVVDNAQSADDTSLFRQFYKEARVINSSENLGFAGGNNLGIQQANGDYVLLLNNDTEVKDGMIEQLLDCFTSTNIGAVSPVIKYYDTPDKIQFAGFTEINAITGRNELIHSKPANGKTLSSPYFHGAAVMIPKFVINQCGLMPEDYFLYYEELDWSRRFVDQGFEILVCLEAEILHKESISTGKNSPLKVYYQTRNRIHFMNGQKTSPVPFLTFFILFSTPKNMLSHLFKSEFKHLKAFCKGFWDGLVLKKMGFQKI